MVTLNRIVAVAETDGPDVALDALDAAANEPGLAGHHRVAAVRAHLLERLGRPREAQAQYLAAAKATLSRPEREYLERRARALG
ncbi:putative RNA polymerase sigma factor [Phytomonospora endophytica]|uniref:Putative RNA polymerase sigma factor n=1 Tax=Phytomonospora endophytica TaxID=714109 RepID=A0A841G3F6_9ACTN|nr:putative RNA polymerase sigma factor [Phytomonospora endophytica]GIG69206.1 hypothetical protein Pen01_55010 [Phytomonospora endophytica]